MDAIVHGSDSLPRKKKKRFGTKFLFPPKHVATNNDSDFFGETVLLTVIYLKEDHFPSKVKKFGSNTNASNLIRKNLIRWKILYNVCFKHRAIFTSIELNNHEKEELKEHFKACTYQCGYPLFPNKILSAQILTLGIMHLKRIIS